MKRNNMKQDAYRSDGTFHSRIYRDENGKRYMSRHFNEKGNLYSICNYNGEVFHGKVKMYNQCNDIKADSKRNIEEKIFSNTIAQTTYYINGKKSTENEFNQYKSAI